jgi:hypothetical protein
MLCGWAEVCQLGLELTTVDMRNFMRNFQAGSDPLKNS